MNHDTAKAALALAEEMHQQLAGHVSIDALFIAAHASLSGTAPPRKYTRRKEQEPAPEGLREFLQQHKGSKATAAQVWRAFFNASATPSDAKKMGSWLRAILGADPRKSAGLVVFDI